MAPQPLRECLLSHGSCWFLACSQPLRNAADGALPSGLEGVLIDSHPTVMSPLHEDHDMDGPFGNLNLDALGSGEEIRYGSLGT